MSSQVNIDSVNIETVEITGELGTGYAATGGGGGATIAVDKTLTVSGAAADAKVTGEKIKAAQTAADEAKTTASKAQSTADTADVKAEAAQRTAYEVNEKAEAAQSIAEEAENMANRLSLSLESKADKADIPDVSGFATKEEVESVNTAASNAQTTANEAKTAASKAQSTADEADVKAEAAQRTAYEVNEKAEAAQSIAEEAENMVNRLSLSLESKADKTDIPDVSGLATKEEVESVNTAASNAQTTANEAKTAAEAAQAAAVKAQAGVDALNAEYELIETVTIDEDDVSSVERKFTTSALYLLMTSPSGSSGTCAIIGTCDNGTSVTSYWNVAQSAAQWFSKIENGIPVTNYIYATGETSTPSILGLNLASIRKLLNAETKAKKFQKISLVGSIPNGSKIEIYGVKV